MKLLKSKKAFNDVSIIAGILGIFLLTAILLPLISSTFGVTSDEWDVEAYEENIKTEGRDIGTLSAFNVLITVVKLAFYDFGDDLGLPFWLDMVYTLLSIILILTVARNIWIGGGG